jgi:enoyl-[acyl-carrier-protein] reductase (NADH)
MGCGYRLDRKASSGGTAIAIQAEVEKTRRISRGIGAAIAKRLATDGASVAVTYSKGALPSPCSRRAGSLNS